MRQVRQRKIPHDQKKRLGVIPELQKYAASEEVSNILTALEVMKLSNDIRRQYAIQLLDDQAYRRLP
jgi:hypothetical protein